MYSSASKNLRMHSIISGIGIHAYYIKVTVLKCCQR